MLQLKATITEDDIRKAVVEAPQHKAKWGEFCLVGQAFHRASGKRVHVGNFSAVLVGDGSQSCELSDETTRVVMKFDGTMNAGGSDEWAIEQLMPLVGTEVGCAE